MGVAAKLSIWLFLATLIIMPLFGLAHYASGVRQIELEGGNAVDAAQARQDLLKEVTIKLVEETLVVVILMGALIFIIDRWVFLPLEVLGRAMHSIEKQAGQVAGWVESLDPEDTSVQELQQMRFSFAELRQMADGFIQMVEAIQEGQKRISESERSYHQVFNATSEAIFIHDAATGQILDVNEAALRMYGYTRAEFLNLPVGQLSAGQRPYSDADAAAWIRKAIEEGQQLFEWWARRSGGELFWGEVALTVSEIGGQRRVLAVVRDISERKGVEAELEQYREHLEELVHERTGELEFANRELESFSYSVSHDLRAPLRHIAAYSHLVLEDYAEQLPDEAQQYLQNISTSAQQMGELIASLLNFSRLGRQALQPELVHPAELVQDVLAQMEVDLTHYQVLVGDLPDCQADAVLLRQVYANLLSNAFKYTRKCSQPRVEIGAVQQQGCSAYFVRDNGIGFDPRYIHQLFGVFQRLHSDPEYEGSGIGLATTQRIIQRHGGEIWADSAVGQGATFYFTINCMRAG